jgi:heme-degrading monooxygenase HmoA
MHARMTRFKGDPGQMDSAIKSYRDALSQFAAIDGNRGAFLFIDRDGGAALGITLWENEDAIVAARERANELRQQAAEEVSAQVVSVEEFEVAVWEPQA